MPSCEAVSITPTSSGATPSATLTCRGHRGLSAARSARPDPPLPGEGVAGGTKKGNAHLLAHFLEQGAAYLAAARDLAVES